LALVQTDCENGETNATERVFYYSNDLNDCPARLLDESGAVVWAALYDAWGKVKRLPVDQVEQPLRLQGQYFDVETELCYTRFRYYSPETGAFISQDPLGLVPGINPYQYAANIWGWTDPLGLCRCHFQRPAQGSQGVMVPIASDFIKDKRRVGHSSRASDFYSVPNQNGGKVYVSDKPIKQSDFRDLINEKQSGKRNFTVLTGGHGDVDGYIYPEQSFYQEDLAKWSSKKGVQVYDITQMSDSQISWAVNSPGKTVCAWCYSERSQAVLRGLGFIP
jgi:RHS repeat-associated protein